MMYSQYAYGHDFGNAETAGVVWKNDKSQVITMPSTLYNGTHEKLVQKMNGTSSVNINTVINEQAHTIAIKGNNWYVGNLAINQAPTHIDIADLTRRGVIERYWSDPSLALLLTTSGTLIKDREYGLGVVTNLPIDTYSETRALLIKNALSGVHQFTLDGIERKAHVRIYKTIMEGAGANIAHGPGGNQKTAVIDIGGRTTNAYMAQGQIPSDGLCKSLDRGVESAADAITLAFENQFSYPLSLTDARKLLYNYVHGKRYQEIATVVNAAVSNAAVDLLIATQLRETGKEIAGFIKRLWASSLRSEVVASDVIKVLLVGGGAHFFADDLRSLFKNRLVIPNTPEYANAIGNAMLAKHYLGQELHAQAG